MAAQAAAAHDLKDLLDPLRHYAGTFQREEYVGLVSADAGAGFLKATYSDVVRDIVSRKLRPTINYPHYRCEPLIARGSQIVSARESGDPKVPVVADPERLLPPPDPRPAEAGEKRESVRRFIFLVCDSVAPPGTPAAESAHVGEWPVQRDKSPKPGPEQPPAARGAAAATAEPAAPPTPARPATAPADGATSARGNDPWNLVEVDAIIFDPNPAENRIPQEIYKLHQRFACWDVFCRRHHGEAVLMAVDVRRDKDLLTDESQAALRRCLLRLAAPRWLSEVSAAADASRKAL